MSSPDIVVIGAGMGGATIAHALAPSGAEILILDKGHQLPDRPENRDARAIFQRGFFRPQESWYDSAGKPFNPGNYYYNGGNSKFYGAVLMRYRAEDFDGLAHADGDTPRWPFRYGELAPWYDRAEALYQVRGETGTDPTEPAHGGDYPFAPVPDERPIAEVRERLRRIGLKPFPLPLGVDIERWLSHGRTPWDAFPDARTGKMDAETCALLPALTHANVHLRNGVEVRRLIAEPGGGRIEAVEYVEGGETRRVAPKLVVLAAGAVRSAAILLASGGVANRSDMVGRHFMNHNLSAMIGIDPRFHNDSIYQKTFGLNDFYLGDGKGGPPLGNVQLLGRVSGAILKSDLRRVPEFLLEAMSRKAIDFLIMSEDLPDPASRVRLDGERIVLEWRRSNMTAHEGLKRVMRAALRQAGFPLVLTHLFDRRTPSHQCGTIRIGSDPAAAPLDPFGRAFDHPNLFVADASTLVTSAAVNPSLTVAALALRAAGHIRETELRA
ncbi:FAD-dependent oxidoreductase [Labrys monachus]|uniref:Choline dehydrogenase-like flavoprotein n=1 Tax=Labrys monachus TaxID=217067 RepID=A0ABU0FJE9_9HYPH|nr:GMC family oxidoreductase [Labrys monachus]MDQ0394732.1 choline dehydrogenase-like flavoprotein [Labrys monachus]